ncbi:MAG: DUF3299 domain-containing protein [Planctomycetes bacterium]|nr:DUF3299 domain-containing protein [Planctomycetota bacterium]
MNDRWEAVRERNLDLALEELSGRATPPDRTATILQRIGEAERRNLGLPWRHLGAAATVLLGIGVTFAVAWTRSAPTDPRTPVAGAHAGMAPVTTVVQDPKPTPPAKPPKTEPAPPRVGKATGNPEAKNESRPKREHPAGTSSEDLRAARSAEAMLAAERTLSKWVLDGKFPGIKDRIDFADLSAWTYTKGLEGMPPEVKALAGKKVLMTGFMLPIDEVDDMHEFLLVQSLWACCYGTPPDIHGLVRCVLPEGLTTDHHFEPMCIVGTLQISETVRDGYCIDIYQLNVESVRPIR